MPLTDAEHFFTQDLIEHCDGEMQAIHARNEVALEFAGRALGLYLVGGHRFGLDGDQDMIDEVVKRARAFRDSAKNV